MSAHSETDLAAAIEGCEKEPVHLPGAIQSFGCMLVLDADLEHVLHASANCEQMLGFSSEHAIASRPERLLGAAVVRRLREGLGESGKLRSALTATRTVNAQSRRFFVTGFRVDDRVVIELEPLVRQSGRRLLSVVNSWLAHIGEAHTIPRLLDVLVRGARELTGHDRVMVYEFDGEWNGSVVAEAVARGVDGFLGHHFPASDIPAQVRRLYDVNPIRSIPNAPADPVPLEPAPDVPLDLSQSVLRAVSPVHQVYMQNMGISASLSVAMHGDGALWGLLACHGLRPHPLSPVVRDAVHTLVQMATQRMFLLRARQDARYLQQVLDSRDLLSEARGQLRSPAELLQRHGNEWLQLFHACGAALLYRDESVVATVGDVPDLARLKDIARWLRAHKSGSMTWETSELGASALADLGLDERLCGLLAVQLQIEQTVSGWLLLFRPEEVSERLWGGNPQKHRVDNDAGMLRLSPRQSFASWLEEVRGQSRRWRGIERRAAIDLGEDLAVAISAHEIGELNARLLEANERLELLAHTDPLTQAWNRYRIEQAMDAEFSVAARYQRPCALLLFDVDEFKRVNDTHGHDVGDQVLRRLAEVVGAELRESDQLGRWGGEEFLVLAAHTNLEQAMVLAERLRLRVAETEFPVVEQVTISIGVAAWHPGDHRRMVIERADRAMYRAKQAGRNRVAAEAPPA